MRDKILLTGMQFWGFHGVFKEEQALGQIFKVDLELAGDFFQASQTDNLAYGVSYAEVYKRVKSLVEDTRFQLIEALAEHIAQTLLAEFCLAEVLVRVNKPNAPIGGIFSNVAVELHRVKANG